jgi:hypothetical protein
MPAYYEIRVAGHLDITWSDELEGLRVEHQLDDDTAETRLVGTIRDQIALQALLNKLFALNIQLVYLRRFPVPPEHTAR